MDIYQIIGIAIMGAVLMECLRSYMKRRDARQRAVGVNLAATQIFNKVKTVGSIDLIVNNKSMTLVDKRSLSGEEKKTVEDKFPRLRKAK